MKKFLLALLVIGVTSTAANATYHVQYMNTGTPASSSYGAPAPLEAQFGRNAAFTPENRARAGARKRAIKHENQYYNGLEKGWAPNVNINNTTNIQKDSEQPATETKSRFLRDKFAKDKLKNKD